MVAEMSADTVYQFRRKGLHGRRVIGISPPLPHCDIEEKGTVLEVGRGRVVADNGSVLVR
jgi:hypothetical protein